MAVLFPVIAFSSSKRLIDSDEYNDKKFKQGIISNYNDLTNDRGIDWVWIKPGIELSKHTIKLGKIENKTSTRSRVLVDTIKTNLMDAFYDTENYTKGRLTADLCIYDADHSSEAKGWIPFAGEYLRQAGIGLEMILRDEKSAIVAKFRHYARKGNNVTNAAFEATDDLKKYIAEH